MPANTARTMVVKYIWGYKVMRKFYHQPYHQTDTKLGCGGLLRVPQTPPRQVLWCRLAFRKSSSTTHAPISQGYWFHGFSLLRWPAPKKRAPGNNLLSTRLRDCHFVECFANLDRHRERCRSRSRRVLAMFLGRVSGRNRRLILRKIGKAPVVPLLSQPARIVLRAMP